MRPGLSRSPRAMFVFYRACRIYGGNRRRTAAFYMLRQWWRNCR